MSPFWIVNRHIFNKAWFSRSILKLNHARAPPFGRVVAHSRHPHIEQQRLRTVAEREDTVSEGKYSVELFKEGAEDAGDEEIVDRHDNLTVARAIYRGRVSQYPGRLVKLRDRSRVLARSDRPDRTAPKRGT
jgi:hypothetical protein